jgi:hypothetical protein
LKRLVKARHNAGYLLEEVAKRLGRPHSFISKCKLGERRLDIKPICAPDNEFLADLYTTFGISSAPIRSCAIAYSERFTWGHSHYESMEATIVGRIRSIEIGEILRTHVQLSVSKRLVSVRDRKRGKGSRVAVHPFDRIIVLVLKCKRVEDSEYAFSSYDVDFKASAVLLAALDLKQNRDPRSRVPMTRTSLGLVLGICSPSLKTVKNGN